jgi:hypothetical protein
LSANEALKTLAKSFWEAGGRKLIELDAAERYAFNYIALIDVGFGDLAQKGLVSEKTRRWKRQ